jgi:hypothetical protein
MDGTVQICRGFAVIQWRTLYTRLTNRDGTNSDDQEAWRCAIEVFERRIRERFLSCIEALETADSRLDISLPDEAPADCSTLPHKNEAVVPGFAIMALCCLLGETLQSFRSRAEIAPRPETRCSYPDGPCIKTPQTTTADAFKAFLRRPAFGDAFADEQIASSFVSGVRNGILHEAETRNWVIWRSEPEKQIVAKRGDGYVLNRSTFYRALKDDFAQYLEELRNSDNGELRSRFRKKMNDIAKEA